MRLPRVGTKELSLSITGGTLKIFVVISQESESAPEEVVAPYRTRERAEVEQYRLAHAYPNSTYFIDEWIVN